MTELVDIFEKYLQKKGLKLTKTRKIILNSIFENSGHFNVDSLYDKIREKHKNVSRATIYRTMPLLIDAGLVKQAMRCKAKDHYEGVYGRQVHLHFICTKCGEITEITNNSIEEAIFSLAKMMNFSIREYNMGAKGICHKCMLKMGKNLKTK